jgi:hypothetical protein
MVVAANSSQQEISRSNRAGEFDVKLIDVSK